MKPIDINFAGGRLRSLRLRRKQHHRLSKATVLLGLVCLLWLGNSYISNLIEGQSLAAAVWQTDRTLHERQLAATGLLKTSLTDNQIKSLNDAISELNQPWRDLFDALEHSNSPDIALISLHADSATKQLILVAESNASSPLLEYVATLKQQPLFSTVLPLSHEENTRDTNTPMRIELNARWGE